MWSFSFGYQKKKSIGILWKERILKFSNQRNKMALEFIQNFSKISTGKLPKQVPYLPSFSFFCVLYLVISTSTLGSLSRKWLWNSLRIPVGNSDHKSSWLWLLCTSFITNGSFFTFQFGTLKFLWSFKCFNLNTFL